MRIATLYRRNLLFHWRTNLATTLCVAAAGAVLTGALLVGDSMRESLRDLAIRRLGPVNHTLTAGRFFREDLVSELAQDNRIAASGALAAPLVLLQGAVEHAATGARAGRANFLGVDRHFAQLGQGPIILNEISGLETSVILNEPLARKLQARPGDDVLVRLGSQADVPAETLLGRRDAKTVSLRLTVARIIPADGWGCFSLSPTQQEPYNAYIALSTLQRALKQRGRINAVLIADGQPASPAESSDRTALLQRILDEKVRLADLGLKLRRDDQRHYLALESESLLLPPAVETAAFAAAEAVRAPATSVLTYLANTISAESPATAATGPSPETRSTPAATRQIPYSTVTAIDPAGSRVFSSMVLLDGRPAPRPLKDEILLNEWAADDLHTRPGDHIRLSYYVMGSFGQLRTQEATFILRGVVRMQGLADDPGLTPEYEGVTDATHVSDWDPPFPIDFDRVRRKDEAYWDEYRATPKAFVALQTGQELWAADSERFGRLSQIRLEPIAGKDLAATASAFERELLRRVRPENMGLAFEPVRAQAITASQGSTDFSMLFMGFSIFLILAAAMLVALVFRLGVERRSSEIGMLLAVGFRPRSVTFILLVEGAVLAGIGSAAGLVGAAAYARLLLEGLQSWWSDAASVPSLQLHVQTTSMLIGFAAGLVVGLLSIIWAVRGLSRMSPRSLLAGAVEAGSSSVSQRAGRWPLMIAMLALAMAVILIAISMTTEALPETVAFFGSGAAMLVASLAALSAWTRRTRRDAITPTGRAAIARLGIRNAARNTRRSLLTAGLIASATFIIVTVGANRQEAARETASKQSGTGGFALVAESTVPILQDLNTADGREALSLSQSTRAALAHSVVVPFRLRSGDEASCLNLYQPRQPRILGATPAMIDRGGFAFKNTLARTEEEKRNPWTLLTRPLPDGAIPAIGDDNTVTWLLHLGLGKNLTITDERGREARLRIAGTLSGSILQGELVVAESRLLELFPSVSGYSFFLIETPEPEDLGRALERDLAGYGFEAASTSERLARYLAVENAYLSAFQTLGGLGLVLGTFGLAAVLLRSVFERRGELALLQALGWRRIELVWMMLAENSALLLSGLVAGAVPAVLAVAPHIASSARIIPWASLALTLAIVFLIGTIAALLALITTMRSPLLPSLRTE